MNASCPLCTSCRHHRTRIAAAVLLLGLFALDGLASAQDSARDIATRKLREGNVLFEQKQYEAALTRYLEARAIYPSPRLDYNIASVYDELGQRPQAATFYVRFLRQLLLRDVESNRAAALQRLRELRGQLGSVTLRGAVAGAEVLLDGRALGRTPLVDDPIYLEPGAHVLKVQHPDHLPFQRDFVAVHGVALIIVVPWAAPAPTAVAQPESLFQKRFPVDDKPHDDAAQLRRRKTIWGYSALGVGLGLAATAGVLFAVGFLEGNDAHAEYHADGRGNVVSLSDMDEHYAKVEVAAKMLIAADVIAGAAAVSLAFAIYELVTRPALERPARREARLRLAPGQAGLSFVGSF